MCAVCGTVWFWFGVVSFCCVWESLVCVKEERLCVYVGQFGVDVRESFVWVWGSMWVLCVGEFVVSLGDCVGQFVVGLGE